MWMFDCFKFASSKMFMRSFIIIVLCCMVYKLLKATSFTGKIEGNIHLANGRKLSN